MEIKVSNVKSVLEIIRTASISNERSCEELRIYHPNFSVTIIYGKSERSISINLLNHSNNMEWKNGAISFDEIYAFINDNIKVESK